LEHSRIYRFENDGHPKFYIGSADWMRRNLDRRIETILPVTDLALQQELEEIRQVLENDNCSAWDMQPDGSYLRRNPHQGDEQQGAQEMFTHLYRRRLKSHRENQSEVIRKMSI
jgi:polyphosphate kinase